MLAQGFDRIVGATRPVAAVRGHHRPKAELVAADQRRHDTNRRPIGPAVHRSGLGGVRRRSGEPASRPAQIASRSARSICLNCLRPVRPGTAERVPARTLPSAAVEDPLPLEGPPSPKAPAKARVVVEAIEADGWRTSRTRTAGGARRASSDAGARRQDSRTTRLTVFRRTAERSRRLGTLMINRGTLLDPFRSATRTAVASSRTAD